MVDFYIKKHTESPKFKPHYNSSMGKYYHTKDDYHGDIKKHGLEPYKGDIQKDTRKAYIPSKESHEFVESLKRKTDKHGNVELSGNQQKYLRDRLSMKSTKDLNPNQGGFS